MPGASKEHSCLLKFKTVHFPTKCSIADCRPNVYTHFGIALVCSKMRSLYRPRVALVVRKNVPYWFANIIWLQLGPVKVARFLKIDRFMRERRTWEKAYTKVEQKSLLLGGSRYVHFTVYSFSKFNKH